MIPFVQLQSRLKNNDLLLHNTVSKLENPNSQYCDEFTMFWPARRNYARNIMLPVTVCGEGFVSLRDTLTWIQWLKW